MMGETISLWLVCPLRLHRTTVASGFRGRKPVCDGLTRTTLELKCTNCGTVFKKTFEGRGRSTFYSDGEMVKLQHVLTSAAANGSVSRKSTASADSKNASEKLQGILWNGSAEKGWSSWL